MPFSNHKTTFSIQHKSNSFHLCHAEYYFMLAAISLLCECSQLAGRNEKRRRVRGGRNYVAQVHLQYRKIFHSIYFKPVHCKDAHMRFCSHKNGNPIHCARWIIRIVYFFAFTRFTYLFCSWNEQNLFLMNDAFPGFYWKLIKMLQSARYSTSFP